ncbi:MAG: pyruvate ferredoxin oxidoreductase [Chloroflexi bacterium]|nr:pyruvate ferredoxin oxidoreductase [Chloroflexota bacterium]
MSRNIRDVEKALDHTFASGHSACSGCGEALGARLVLRAAGKNVILTTATGCLEVFSANYPYSSWGVPWIHSLFENSAAVASGIEAALRVTGKLGKTKVIAQGGDGATADIGFGALSGMFDRGHDILYVCYDNEAYMNTGVQRSGLTPYDASTTTSPAGKEAWGNPRPKKDLPQIVVAHGVPYVATASVAYPHDLDRKVKKALSIHGPKYIQVHVPCPLGWRHDSALTIDIAELAVKTGLYPLVEFENGKLVAVRRIPKKVPVEEYLKPQGRFAHLFRSEEGRSQIEVIQVMADANIERYHLMARPETEVEPWSPTEA